MNLSNKAISKPSKHRGTPVSCLDIFDNPVGDYIKECIRASEGSTKVFFHIPKTGGSSIRLALKEEIPKLFNVKQYSELDRWDEILKQHHTDPYDMISGHLRFGELRKLYKSGANIVPISFIRDPVSRILSQYRFMVSPKYPYYQNFKEKFPTIEKFVLHGIPENPMLEIIVGKCKTVHEAIHRAGRNYMFIGLTEYSVIHSFLVQRCFGIERFHIPRRVNTTVETVDNQIELNDRLLELIQHRSSLDIGFYDFFKTQHLSIIDGVFSEFCRSVSDGELNISFQDGSLVRSEQPLRR